MTESTRSKALAALDGMREIVRREMLITGTYVQASVSNPNLTGAICGGRKHCAIGALWVGGGVKPVWGGRCYPLPGADQDERVDFLRHRAGLRLAYDCLNAAAEDFIDRDDEGRLSLDRYFSAPIEALFEGNYDDGDLTKRDLLRIIAAAKRKVKAA